MGGLQNFVGAWLRAINGDLAVRDGVSDSDSNSEGGGASGDPSIVGNGLTNGELVIDHICHALGIPQVPPYKNQSSNFSNGANFALAGSTALPGSFLQKNNLLSLIWKTIPQTYELQLQWFNEFMQKLKSGAKPDMERALFWIGSVGARDFSRIHMASTFSAGWVTHNAIDHVHKLIQGMVKHGAKFFVVQGLPPIGCLPLDLILSPVSERDQFGCAARINKAVLNHNVLLQKKLGELQKLFPHCVFVYADVWKAFTKVLAAHHKFGFQEPFKACCGFGGGPLNFQIGHLCGTLHTSVCPKAAKHIIWDGIHLTAAMHKVLAKLLIHGRCTHPTIPNLIKFKKGLIHHLF
ncbi:hypothetical protein SAY86_008884 [Trapa natans]|uniref:GDSL esterase/lipase At3g48460-like n=1 Tax=Trapa natans TaxID=22666 RepID=A0AAN7KFK1_TRANT|nr:hypothetical protein SAY86_008884 [Trapa natans]